MTIISISQSMYFPWLGHFELIRLSDKYFHYDDVQLTRGFYNRVQAGSNIQNDFITIPISNRKQKQLICESNISYNEDWITVHRQKLKTYLERSRYYADAINLFDLVTKERHTSLHTLNRKSIHKIWQYLSINNQLQFADANGLHSNTSGTARLLNICKDFGAKVYLTGHGALNYLDHELFEQNGIEVHYLKYQLTPYSKGTSAYTPFVTALEPIAYLGKNSGNLMHSKMTYWREAIKNPQALLPNFEQ